MCLFASLPPSEVSIQVLPPFPASCFLLLSSECSLYMLEQVLCQTAVGKHLLPVCSLSFIPLTASFTKSEFLISIKSV